MNEFDRFIASLDALGPLYQIELAEPVLAQAWNMRALLRRGLTAAADDAFVRGVRKEHIAAVEPRVLMIFERPAAYQVIVHHFSRSRFDAHLSAGRIGPHQHHFDFATRIVRGSYYNLFFTDRGDCARLQLELDSQRRCVEGDVYSMRHQRFHCVLGPEDDAISLMVRGPALFDAGHQLDPHYTDEDIHAMRRHLLTLTVDCARSPGRVVTAARPIG